MTLTVGTFNLNNLFDRWNFEGALDVLASGTSSVPATYTFDDEVLTVLGTHLKSKFVDFTVQDPAEAAAAALLLRTRQAETIVRIIGSRMSTRQRYLLCGDMNDTPDSSALVAYAHPAWISLDL
jgi:hypothetical protein